jgi:hypothetical protein
LELLASNPLLLEFFFQKRKRKRKDFNPSTWRKGRGVTREEIVEKKNCIHANQKNAATYK